MIIKQITEYRKGKHENILLVCLKIVDCPAEFNEEYSKNSKI